VSTIGGDGGIRWAPDPRPEPAAEVMALAAEMARRLAAMLDEQNARAAQETARLLVEVPRLPPEAQETFLTSAAGPSPDSSQGLGGPAETVRERIAQAFPEESDRRRELGAVLVSIEGGDPAALAPRTLEAKVASALAKLGAFSSVSPSSLSSSSSAARPPASDAMERRRGFGPFGGVASPLPTATASAGSELSATSLFGVAHLGTPAATFHPTLPSRSAARSLRSRTSRVSR